MRLSAATRNPALAASADRKGWKAIRRSSRSICRPEVGLAAPLGRGPQSLTHVSPPGLVSAAKATVRAKAFHPRLWPCAEIRDRRRLLGLEIHRHAVDAIAQM